MRRNPLLLASVGGVAAVLAAAGVFLGVTAADNDRARQTTLTAATSAPTTAGVPDDATPPGAAAPATGEDAVNSVRAGDDAVNSKRAGDDAVNSERAGEIALAHVGGGQITEIERDRENSRPVWEVEIVRGETEHEIDIDRETGQVVKAEQEPVDDDRDDD